MTHFENIIYLEDTDLTSDGVISQQVLPDDTIQKALLFVYGDFCPHCTDIKPLFQEFARQTQSKVIPLVLKVDGSDSEYSVVMKLKKIMSPDFKGIPVFFGIKNRKISKMIPGHQAHSIQKLTNFVNSL